MKQVSLGTKALLTAALVLVLGAFGTIFFVAIQQTQLESATNADRQIADARYEASNREVGDLRSSVITLETILEKQREQFLTCQGEDTSNPACREPVAPAVSLPASAEVPVSLSTVRLAVAQYCVGDRCRGEDGESIEPTPADVSTAVQLFCANGACVGQTGATGSPGNDGTPGRDAPPVTSDQIAAQVAAYCSANGGCRGREIETVVCNDASNWEFRYNDGSVDTVQGPCRLSPLPPMDPEPTPDPTEDPTPGT